jgi:hypothetical protein
MAPSGLLSGKNYRHLAQSFRANQFERSQNVRFIFNEQFRTRRNAERALAEEDLPQFAADASFGEFLFDLLDF